MENQTKTHLTIDLEKLENKRRDSNGWTAACPLCRSNGSDKTGNHLKVYNSGKFSCIVAPRDKDHNRGILELVGMESDGLLSSQYVQPEEKIELEEVFPDEIISRLVKDYSYWEKRGIPASILSLYEGGVALSGKLKNRYCFVMRNAQNKIHGFDARYLYKIPDKFPVGQKKIPKWKKIGLKETFIFDRFNVEKAVKRAKKVILVEGIGCVLALRKVGIDYVVPIEGVSISSALLAKLIGWNPDEIIISLNNELGNTKASINGNDASIKTKNKLLQFFNSNKIKIRLPDEKDWMDCNDEQLKNFAQEICHK